MDVGADVTALLGRVQQGDPNAADRLLPLIYDELKRRAQAYMSNERRNHTLQATALVHEAYVRLLGGQRVAFQSRAHFFNAAAQAMRRLLVDHARARSAERRGGGAARVDIDKVDVAVLVDDQHDDGSALGSLDAALDKLQKLDPRRHQVVMYRYFAGLAEQEIADILGLTTKTVQRDWKAAKLFLTAEMQSTTTAAKTE